MSVRIEECAELLTLHRAIMEAKFNEHPNDPVLAGSTYLADVANRVQEWRNISPERREWGISINHIQSIADAWKEWSIQDKEHYVKILLSPLKIAPAELDQFIREADLKVNTR